MQRDIMILDGAWGTMLQKHGMPPSACPERWALDRAELVQRIGKAYVDAGAQAILAPTFGGNPVRLRAYGLEGEYEAINQGLVQLLREILPKDFPLGASMGPSGQKLLTNPAPVADRHLGAAPYSQNSPITFEDAVLNYATQAQALCEAGVDYFHLETMADLNEARAGMIGIRQVCHLPIHVSMYFIPGESDHKGGTHRPGTGESDHKGGTHRPGTGESDHKGGTHRPGTGESDHKDGTHRPDPTGAGQTGNLSPPARAWEHGPADGYPTTPAHHASTARTPAGDSPACCAIVLEALGAEAVGANCGASPADLWGPVAEMAQYTRRPLIAKASAGLPEDILDPAVFAAQMLELAGAGARYLGGCCGSTPEHIHAIRKRVRGLRFLPRSESREWMLCSRNRHLPFANALIIGNLRVASNSRFLARIREGEYDAIRGEIDIMGEAQMLCINAVAEDLDEVSALKGIAQEAWQHSDLPMAFRPQRPAALEGALREYPGRALVILDCVAERDRHKVQEIASRYGALCMI